MANEIVRGGHPSPPAVDPVKIAQTPKPAIIVPKKEIIIPSGILSAYYSKKLDEIDKRLGLAPGAENVPTSISSGVLCVDWVIGGGVRAVFNQVAGMEQSAKTSLTFSVLGSAYQNGVPLISFIDAEGTMTPDYADAIFHSFGNVQFKDVFDQRLRRYYSIDILEEATNQMASLIRRFPNKVWNSDIGAWCYVLPRNSREWTPVLDILKQKGLSPDKTASAGNFWCYPTDYSGPEAALFVDSWPALKPEAVDEAIETGKGAGLGIFARVMAEELPKFAGRLKRKGVIFWSVNQLRERPMSMGDPFYEPGGNALKLYSTIRNQMKVRVPIQGWDRDPKARGLCIEESVTGNGFDRYAFKSFQNTKQKLGRPFLSTWLRVWTSDERGDAQGIDPVFDCFQYLSDTGQIEGGHKKFRIKFRPSVKGNARMLDGLQLEWWQFKAIVLGEHFGRTDYLKPALQALKLELRRPKLREALFQQVKSDRTLWTDVVGGSASEEDAEVADNE